MGGYNRGHGRTMPRRDIIHEAVKNALVKDGWTITDNPLFLEYGTEDMYVDLGAERLLAAERGTERIAVERNRARVGAGGCPAQRHRARLQPAPRPATDRVRHRVRRPTPGRPVCAFAMRG